MEETEKEKLSLTSAKKANQTKLTEVKQKLRAELPPEVDLSKLKVELEELEKQQNDYMKKEEELSKKEKLAPWNVDTISKEGFTKTVINKAPARKNDDLSDEERDAKQREFVKQNEQLVKKYGMLQKYDDSKKYLKDHPQLACDETANYLVMWCINLEMDEKSDLMEHVSHQTICMQYVLELAKQLDVDPRGCIDSFFTRIQTADKQYVDAFEDEVKAFKKRVRDRVKVKLEQALKEAEEEEKSARLGPGGLDPVEVFESLPAEMQACFEERNIEKLQEVIAKLPQEEARVHMERCVGSGLWIPDAKTLEMAGQQSTESTETPAE